LAAQLAGGRRGAAALGGAALLVLFFLDALSRVNDRVGLWSRLSPFRLRDATTSLAPGGAFDVGATVALFVLAGALAALSAVAFAWRDLGASLLRQSRRDRPPVLTPSPNPLLRMPVLSSLYEQRLGLLAWTLGTVALAAFTVSLATATTDLLRGNAAFQGYFRAAHTGDPTLVVLGLFWFGVAAFLVVVYAIVQVGRWAADDGEGRLELTIAQPVPRWRVVVERALTLTAAVLLIAAAGSLAVAAVAPGQGIHVDGGRLLLATVLLAPLALSVGALGAAVTARLPRLAVPFLSAVALVSYLVQQLGPLFEWPEWALDLSLFQLYGTPLINGVFVTGLYAMVGIVVAGFGVALAAMRYRDVGA
jgi:ABC-2 type transport system permease protein